MRKLEILVVEDNPPDVAWLEYVLQEAGLQYHLTIARNGEQGVDGLLRRGDFAEAKAPDLIFLDMHLPVFGGLEILRRVPGSVDLPICVLTSSKEEENAVRDYFGRAISYLLKPISAESLRCCIRSHTAIA
jgi:CheY-like chemotaxis protein